MTTRRIGFVGLAIISVLGTGWVSNVLAAPACCSAARAKLQAALSWRFPTPATLRWIEPPMLAPDPEYSPRLLDPYTYFKPAPRVFPPYAWVRVGSLGVPFIVPVYEACLINGQAGGGYVTLFFSPLGSRAPLTRRVLWVN